MAAPPAMVQPPPVPGVPAHLAPDPLALRAVVFEALVPPEERAREAAPKDGEAYEMTEGRRREMEAAAKAAEALAKALVPALRPKRRRAPSVIRNEERQANVQAGGAALPPGAREFPARIPGSDAGPGPNDPPEEVLNKQRVAVNTRNVEVTFPAELAGALIGKGGANIERIKTQTACRIALRSAADGSAQVSRLAPDAPAKCTISGPTAEHVGGAVAMVQASLVAAPQWQARVTRGDGGTYGARQADVPLVKRGGLEGEADPDGGLWIAIPAGQPLAEGGKVLGFEVDPPSYPGRKVRRKAELGILLPPPEPLPFKRAPVMYAAGSTAAPLPGSEAALDHKRQMREAAEQRRIESSTPADAQEHLPPPPAGGPPPGMAPGDNLPAPPAPAPLPDSLIERIKAQAQEAAAKLAGGGGQDPRGPPPGGYPPPPGEPRMPSRSGSRPGLGSRPEDTGGPAMAEDRVDIPCNVVSLIIGRQGMNIKGLQERSGAKIDILNHEPARADARQLQRAMEAGVPPGRAAVVLRGTQEQVERGRAEVQALLGSAPQVAAQMGQPPMGQPPMGQPPMGGPMVPPPMGGPMVPPPMGGPMVPPGMVQPGQRGYGAAVAAAARNQQQQGGPPPPMPPPPPPPPSSEWTTYSDEQGRPFWYNTRTGESSWTAPA